MGKQDNIHIAQSNHLKRGEWKGSRGGRLLLQSVDSRSDVCIWQDEGGMDVLMVMVMLITVRPMMSEWWRLIWFVNVEQSFNLVKDEGEIMKGGDLEFWYTLGI